MILAAILPLIGAAGDPGPAIALTVMLTFDALTAVAADLSTQWSWDTEITVML